MERFPADQTAPATAGRQLAVWIARDIQPYPSDPKSTGKPQGRLDPDVHARSVILALDSRCEALGVYPALLPAAALQVCGIAIGRAAEQRKAGRLDDARWTAASLFAFGKLLVRRDPNEASFHVVLSEAFDQEAKNAWKSMTSPPSKRRPETRWSRPGPRYASTPGTWTRDQGRGSPGQDDPSELPMPTAEMNRVASHKNVTHR